MEESDELGVRAMASEPANAILNLNAPSKTREEGELSSSGDEVPACNPGKPSPGVVSNSVSLALNDTQAVQGGSNGIQLQKTMQSASQKSFNRSQLPPKSSMWPAHAGTDKSLVISFSDDDSGSDSEVGKQDKAVESKGNTSRLDNNQKRSTLSLAKSYKLVNGARSVTKSVPKRLPLNHTSFSSGTKIHGSNSKVAGSFSLGQASRSRNFYTLNKNLASQDRKNDQGVISSNNKLQDLRQQIAIRESELKLKAAQLNKESTSTLGRDHNTIKMKSDTARKYTYSENAHLESKEPDKKRLKLGRSYATPQAVESQPEVTATKSVLPSKESALENCNLQERNKVNHGVKETPFCIGEQVVVSQGHDKHLDISSQTMQSGPRSGTYGSNNCNQMDKHNRVVDSCVNFNQNGLPANVISNSVPTNTELLNNFNDHANDSDHRNIDLSSFFEVEELIDKELEEAQEHRHRCEVEERNALKAYLKAQRALIEANGRCTNLYRKRESYSAKLKSLILNNSGFSWSSGQHAHLDSGLEYLPRYGYVMPTSSCQRQAEFDDVNQPGFDTTNGVNNGPSNLMYHRMNGANLGSEPCSELDASTSEPLPQRGNKTLDGVNSPSDELDTSANDNEEMSPSIHVSTDHDNINERKQYSNANRMDRDSAPTARLSAQDPQDSLLLEAALRSELFARLGTKASNSSSTCNNLRAAAEQGVENENRQTQVVPLSRAEENAFRGNERHESNRYLDCAEIQSQQNTCRTSLISNCSTASRDQGSLALQLHHSMGAMKISPLIFRSAFVHLKQMSKLSSKQLPCKNQRFHVNDGENENYSCHGSIRTDCSSTLDISVPTACWNLASEESSYSYSPAVDPFWPLCMYELRGKCNNDECPWQHVKDYNDGNYQNQHFDNDDADCQGGLTLHQQSARKVPKSHKAAILPTYLVGLDVLRADQLACKSVLTRRNTQYWQKCFSRTLATSNLLQNGLPEDGPFLRGGGERIEVHGTWNKQFSYLQWKRAVNQNEQALADNEQAVEMALLVLNQEINKLEGVRKALSVFSRVLETDPTSVVIWIVYLLIYYGNLKPTGKDDMFLYAVKHNEGSYILWVMYINSRTQLDERLAAYDAALLALCQNTSAVKDGIHTSACILDLFLQMMDCLCMSGNVEKAIQRSYGVFPDTTKSNEPHHLSLSDILNCLTVSDKCVFWICCIYLVIYRKLPDAILQKFECEKDLDIEWPVIHLSEEEKQMAVKRVETAVESVDPYIYNESAKNEVNLRSAQLFALNHIRCMVALDNLECLGSLLDKYVKLYPCSIELVLELVHIQKQENGIDSFMGFEEAISRWPKQIPGIQAIWNQYIENAVLDGRIDFAKEITVRWFQSAWQVQESHDGEMDVTYGDDSCSSLGIVSKSFGDTTSSGLSEMDAMFGFLNLSLYNFFQNDETEACIAIDKARKAANFGGLDNQMRKHAMFLLSDASCLKDNGPNDGIKKILEMYNDSVFQDFISPKLITRKFFDDVKKPRVQQLMSNLLSPVSIDCSVLNLILQSWYGSSLLPQTFSNPKELVDFVEALLEVAPSNFQLAISVCKLLIKGFNSANADQTTASLLFWACSAMVNAILDAIPLPPEHIWVEAGLLLDNVVCVEDISFRFYRRALSVYPFSFRLWKSFFNLCKSNGNADDVIKAAKERGISITLE